MGKFKHFELEEFIASDVAKKMKIDNAPTFEIVDHLSELCENLLEPFREAWGKPISVTSGYRSTKLNSAVGGVSTSAHKLGYGVDIQSGDVNQLFNYLTEWVKAEGVMFDQIIMETKGSTKWVHIGYKNQEGRQRRIITRLTVKEQ